MPSLSSCGMAMSLFPPLVAASRLQLSLSKRTPLLVVARKMLLKSTLLTDLRQRLYLPAADPAFTELPDVYSSSSPSESFSLRCCPAVVRLSLSTSNPAECCLRRCSETFPPSLSRQRPPLVTKDRSPERFVSQILPPLVVVRSVDRLTRA